MSEAEKPFSRPASVSSFSCTRLCSQRSQAPNVHAQAFLLSYRRFHATLRNVRVQSEFRFFASNLATRNTSDSKSFLQNLQGLRTPGFLSSTTVCDIEGSTRPL